MYVLGISILHIYIYILTVNGDTLYDDTLAFYWNCFYFFAMVFPSEFCPKRFMINVGRYPYCILMFVVLPYLYIKVYSIFPF